MPRQRFYTNEKNLQIIMALLKAHGIKKVIASPGSTNHTLVASMQNDPWFEMYSCIDERSAAYMACGLSAESGDSVVITCTEATASRNYMPGLTEAFYRKLPILAIVTTHGIDKVGNLVAQVLDHSVLPNDVAVYTTYIPVCNSAKEEHQAQLKVNESILELTHHGGGPVYLCAESVASRDYSIKNLPKVRKIERFIPGDKLPSLPQGRIGIFVGAHKLWKKEELAAIDRFCEVTGAVVFCDHTSGYKGHYRVDYSLIGSQDMYKPAIRKMHLVIHIGEVSGDYFSYGIGSVADEVWRVSEDGALRDLFGSLKYVFEMREQFFFKVYTEGRQPIFEHPIAAFRSEYDHLLAKMPEIPFTKVWIASQLLDKIPSGSYIHFSILGSLRAGNFFRLPDDVQSACNVGGFGIDGATSSLIGAALAHPDRLHFLMTGDLAFFYDWNAIGNRHLGSNVRILLINNGDGTEFRMYWHPISAFSKEEADRYMAAGGHNGRQSRSLMKHIAEDLGFEYLSAATKGDFLQVYERFLTPEITDKPMLFETFTYSEEDNEAVHAARNLVKDSAAIMKQDVKSVLKKLLGEKSKKFAKKVLNK